MTISVFFKFHAAVQDWTSKQRTMLQKKSAVIPVETEDDLVGWVERSNEMLLIFDLHHGWSGSCETLLPTFELLLVDNENSNERLAFLSLELPKFASKFQELFGGGDEQEKMDFSSRGCAPLFVAVRSNKIVSTVEEANAPALIKIVKEHIPKLSQEE